MDVYGAINARHTVRDFEDREIDRAAVERILDAGLRAPSNNHMREWEFIVVNDRAARLALLAKISRNSGEADAVRFIDNLGMTDQVQRTMYIDAIPKQHRMLYNAGCLVIPCFRQTWPLLTPESLSSLNAFASIWCCIENILIAAAAEGVFGVTRIPFEEEIPHIRAVLGIPEDYLFPCYLALGYPVGSAQPVLQHAPRAADRIHADTW